MSLVKNSAFSALSLAIRVVTAAAALIIQARFLGPETFGKFAFAIAIGAMLSLITDFGMSLRSLRELSSGRYDPRSYVLTDLHLRLLLMIPFTLIALTVAVVGRKFTDQMAFLAVFAGFAAVSAGDYGLSLLRSLGRYSVEAKLAVITFSLQFLITIGFVMAWPTLLGSATGLFVSRVVYLALVALVVARTLPQPKDGASPAPIGHPVETLKKSIPYAQDVLISNGMAQVDVLIAGAALKPVDLGLYAIANRGFQVVSQGLGAASTVFIPAMSSAQTDTPRLRRIANTLFMFSAGASSLALILITCFGGLLQHMVLGSRYDGLAPYWFWIGLSVFSRVLASTTAMAIAAQGLQHVRVRAQFIGLACLGISSVLAFLFRLNGLFAALILTYGVITILQLLALQRSATPPPRWFHPSLVAVIILAGVAQIALHH